MSGDGVQASTLMGLAITAERGGNLSEAYDYYTRVLELEPRSPDAWQGKGRTAGLLSTLAQLRLREMLVAFEHAIGSAANADRAAVAARSQADATVIGRAIHDLGKRHFDQSKRTAGARAAYVGAACEVSDMLEDVVTWTAPGRAVLDLQIAVADDMLRTKIDRKLTAVFRTRRSAAIALRTALPNEGGKRAIAFGSREWIDKNRLWIVLAALVGLAIAFRL